jgi:hypothetical protein
LLLASAIVPLHEPEIALLQGFCCPSIDWAAFISLAARHHLIPTVYRNLSTHCATAVPAPALVELKGQAGLQRQRVFQLLAEMARLGVAFARAGVPLCALKGPLLAQRLFGDIGLRSSTDLDLLVPAEMLAQADELLLGTGCQRTFPVTPFTPRQWQLYQQDWYNTTYHLPAAQLTIELHWTIASPNLVAPEAARQMLARVQAAAQAGSGLLTLAEQDLPVYLLVHGSKHNWVRLKWLVDFAAWMRQAGSQDLQDLAAAMQALGLSRSLGQGLLLTHWLFGDPLPGVFHTLQAEQAHVRRLAEGSVRALVNPNYRGQEEGRFLRFRETFYLMGLKKSLRYKLATLSKFWVRPEDWQELPLPDSLFFLYGVLRPFLWVRHYLSRR